MALNSTDNGNTRHYHTINKW